MVKITPTAITRLHGKLESQPEGTAVRMTVKNGHVRFRPDTQRKGDLVFQHKGQSVLLIGASTARQTSKRTLDVVKTADGNRLRFTRPV
jgi:Fe-S cluster assembly iron-binding protein IscA